MPGPLRIVPFPAFTKGVDLLTSPMFVEDGYASKGKNLEFVRGVASMRKGYRGRTYNNSGIISESGAFPMTSQYAIALARFWAGDASGSEVECIISNKFAYGYAYSDGTLTSIFFDDPDLIQCFESSSVSGSWDTAPVDEAGNIEPTLIFTDGIEYNNEHTLYHWDGSSQYTTAADGQITMDDSSLFGDLQYAKQLIWYADHFMIGDFGDDGTRYRNSVAWGDKNELGIRSGGADNGLKPISDAKGHLLRFIRLGAYLAIYFSESIVICNPVPTDEIYLFDTRVRGVGLLASRAIVDIGGVHIFIGSDLNFYSYDGGLEPVPIGDLVTGELARILNPNALDGIVSQHLPRKHIARFYLPVSDDTSAKAILDYNYRDRTFSGIGQVAHGITASGFGIQSLSYRCNSDLFSGVTCQDLADKSCNDFSSKAGFSIPTLGDSGGEIFELSEVCLTDDGTDISAELWTPARGMGDPHSGFGRAAEIRVESRGSPFYLDYSIDEADRWKNLPGTYGGFTIFTFETIPVDIVGRSLILRYRYPSSGGSSEIRSTLVRARPSSMRGLS